MFGDFFRRRPRTTSAAPLEAAPAGPVASYVCRDGTFSHLSGDECIGRSLALYGEWGFHEIELLKQLIAPGDTVLDIGANVGTHAIAMGHRVGAAGTVLAFEGQPKICALLAHNIIQNDMTGRVDALNLLIGAENKLVPQALFESYGQNSGAKSFFHDVRRSRNEAGGPTIWLPLATVDSLELSSCNLIKIDVEAMEVEVFRGAIATLKKYRPVVYFEHALSGPEHLIAINDLIAPLGYRLAWHIADPFNPRNLRGSTENIFGGAVEVNVLGLPAGVPTPSGVIPIDDVNKPAPRPSKNV